MTYSQFIKSILSTWNPDNQLHAAIGISTEAGELLDAYKKNRFYGRELDIKNIKEEIGDMLFYLTLLCNEIDYSFDEAILDNIEKLKKRYPDGFVDVVVRNEKTELDHIK